MNNYEKNPPCLWINPWLWSMKIAISLETKSCPLYLDDFLVYNAHDSINFGLALDADI